LPFAHRGHCKDEDSYKECSSHVEFSISLTRSRPNYSAIKGGIIQCIKLASLGSGRKIIEHAKIAKQLAGKQPDDTEGATFYLSTHDSWEIFENSTHEQKQSSMLLKASGKFINTPRIRLLGINTNKYRWIKDGIKLNTPTKISYLTKDLSKWQYGLSEEEMQGLNDLKNSRSSDCQLLLGVNSDFLDIEEPIMIRSIKQANDSGWQIFIIELMWLANHWLATYDNLLYEKDFIEKRTLDMMQIICP
jgi:hypothetical protein